MITEQRHPLTYNLRQTITKDISKGLEQLFQVDHDITEKIRILKE